MEAVNPGHVLSYGNDVFTERANASIRKAFGENVEPFFTFSGTAANVCILHHLAQKDEAVICSDAAHIKVHEEPHHRKLTGYEYVIVPTRDGKMCLLDLETAYKENRELNPRVVSVTNPTEYGTVYSPEEIRSIADFAHENGMLVHMDGARIANAAVALGKVPKEISFDCGVDVLFFGGIKNGLMFGETVIFRDKVLSEGFGDVLETLLQTGSKARFVATQFESYLEEEIWQKNASISNSMAKCLEAELRKIPGVRITQEVETNGVWCILPNRVVEPLRESFPFYTWNEATGEIRLLCSFDTTEEDITSFISVLKGLLG